MHIPQFFSYVLFIRTHNPYIILRQNSKKRKRKSIFFMHFFVESMKYSHFYLLAFFTKTNSVSLLYSEILSLLTFSLFCSFIFLSSKLRIRTDPQQSRLLCRSIPLFCSIKSSCAGDGRTDKIQSASEPLTAITIPWIRSASVSSPFFRMDHWHLLPHESPDYTLQELLLLSQVPPDLLPGRVNLMDDSSANISKNILQE